MKGADRFPASLETRNHHQRALSEARRGATEQEKVRPASMKSTLVVVWPAVARGVCGIIGLPAEAASENEKGPLWSRQAPGSIGTCPRAWSACIASSI